MCTGDEIEIAIFLVKQASLIHTTNVMFNHIHMYAQRAIIVYCSYNTDAVIQYTPRGFLTFRKTPRKMFRAENLSVFPKSVLSVFPKFFQFFLHEHFTDRHKRPS